MRNMVKTRLRWRAPRTYRPGEAVLRLSAWMIEFIVVLSLVLVGVALMPGDDGELAAKIELDGFAQVYPVDTRP